MSTAILCSQDLLEWSRWVSEDQDIPVVTSNYEQLRAEILEGGIDRVVVLHGAVNCSKVSHGLFVISGTIYPELKKEFPNLIVKIMDSYLWKGIPQEDFKYLPISAEEFKQMLVQE